MVDNLIMEAVVGSRAYNLHHEGSDYDRIGVFRAPTSAFLGLHTPAETITQSEPDDRTYHELGKYLRLLLKGNPTVTETLFLRDYITRTPVFDAIHAVRDFFLSKKLASAYIGYCTAQIKKFDAHNTDWKGDARYAKNARHTLRLAAQGSQVLETGGMDVWLSDDMRDYLFWACALPPEELRPLLVAAVESLKASEINSMLPEKPDEDFANWFLTDIRKNAILGS